MLAEHQINQQSHCTLSFTRAPLVVKYYQNDELLQFLEERPEYEKILEEIVKEAKERWQETKVIVDALQAKNKT